MKYTPRVKSVLQKARQYAKKSYCYALHTEHILLAILNDRDCMAYHILSQRGVTIDKVLKDLSYLGGMATTKVLSDPWRGQGTLRPPRKR